MIKIENLEVFNLKGAICGMRGKGYRNARMEDTKHL